MKRALVAIHTSTYFTGLADVGRLLKKSGKYAPVFFFVQRYPTLATDLLKLYADGITYIVPDAEPAPSRFSGPPLQTDRSASNRLARWQAGDVSRGIKRIIRGAGRRVRSSFQKVLFSTTAYHVCHLARQLRSISQIFHTYAPALAILGGDLTHYDTAAFIKIAHQQSIPAVVVPAWMASAREAAEAHMYDPAHSARKWFNAFVGKLYPRWVYEHKGRKLLRLPGGQVLAREWLGLAPPLPWILHSGYADAIALESEATRDYGMREGLPANALVVTGSVTHDMMAEILRDASARRADLYVRLGLREDAPMLLCALPPDFLYMVGGRPECEFRSYDELVRFWITAVAAVPDYNIVMALHPSVKYEQMQYIEQWGVKIARDTTAALIPLCDLYVASISATIQWAIACGKPVLNYDVYRYSYTDYLDVDGVITVEDRNQFVTVLRQLTGDPEFFRGIAARQSKCAERWGKLDGRAGERLLQLFERLVAQYQSLREKSLPDCPG
jgi:hypothetical protein